MSSWWVCKPEEFYPLAKREAERMKAEELQEAIAAYFDLEGYSPTGPEGFEAPRGSQGPSWAFDAEDLETIE